jgi:hypothetical protein
MNKSKIIISIPLIILIGIILWSITRNNYDDKGISIIYPLNQSIFPAEFPAPVFKWKSEINDSSIWEILLIASNNKYSIKAVTQKTEWAPEELKWDSLKYLSNYGQIYFILKKSGHNKRPGQIYFQISSDSVGAPILYRQMPIPFILAEKNLDSMNFMLINLGSKTLPYTAMKGFPVCGNCHSFSADGNTIGLDLDAGRRDKGGYFVSTIKDTILFNSEHYMSWSKIEKRRTFGLFSKLSPNGRYIVTTIKDRVVTKNFPYDSYEHVAFSQIFFPVNGHLAIYDRQKHTLKELPGANLDEFVQSNAVWTPDGNNIIFSRAKALPMDSDLLEINVQYNHIVEQFIERKKSFKYDLCFIPFNNGNGGKAELIKGASNNGKSNYFPAVSPDGKWLVYCQAENFMLLMPDSRLYIIPIKGGRAKKLKCNFSTMNSWHSWSPNSKWIVFASKGLSPFTDMFLTHIDKNGNASIPILVDKARVNNRVINYPEFVNRKPQDAFVMEYDYVELAHIERAINEGDMDKARQLFYQLESQQPFLFSKDYLYISNLLYKMGLPKDAKKYAKLADRTINSIIFNK